MEILNFPPKKKRLWMTIFPTYVKLGVGNHPLSTRSNIDLKNLWTKKPAKKPWRFELKNFRKSQPIGSMYGIFIYTFTIKTNQMWVNIPYMDGMGRFFFLWTFEESDPKKMPRIHPIHFSDLWTPILRQNSHENFAGKMLDENVYVPTGP